MFRLLKILILFLGFSIFNPVKAILLVSKNLHYGHKGAICLAKKPADLANSDERLCFAEVSDGKDVVKFSLDGLDPVFREAFYISFSTCYEDLNALIEDYSGGDAVFRLPANEFVEKTENPVAIEKWVGSREDYSYQAELANYTVEIKRQYNSIVLEVISNQTSQVVARKEYKEKSKPSHEKGQSEVDCTEVVPKEFGGESTDREKKASLPDYPVGRTPENYPLVSRVSSIDGAPPYQPGWFDEQREKINELDRERDKLSKRNKELEESLYKTSQSEKRHRDEAAELERERDLLNERNKALREKVDELEEIGIQEKNKYKHKVSDLEGDIEVKDNKLKKIMKERQRVEEELGEVEHEKIELQRKIRVKEEELQKQKELLEDERQNHQHKVKQQVRDYENHQLGVTQEHSREKTEWQSEKEQILIQVNSYRESEEQLKIELKERTGQYEREKIELHDRLIALETQVEEQATQLQQKEEYDYSLKVSHDYEAALEERVKNFGRKCADKLSVLTFVGVAWKNGKPVFLHTQEPRSDQARTGWCYSDRAAGEEKMTRKLNNCMSESARFKFHHEKSYEQGLNLMSYNGSWGYRAGDTLAPNSRGEGKNLTFEIKGIEIE